MNMVQTPGQDRQKKRPTPKEVLALILIGLVILEHAAKVLEAFGIL